MRGYFALLSGDALLSAGLFIVPPLATHWLKKSLSACAVPFALPAAGSAKGTAQIGRAHV
jgi:hypothetical protein